MPRDFIIPYDYSRISGSVYVTTGYVPTVENDGSSYLGTYPSDSIVYLPTINLVTSYIAQIPIIQQVPCAPSLKFTGYPYILNKG